MYLGLVLIVMIVSGTYILLSLRNIEIDKSSQELATYAERINEQVIEGGKDEEFQEKLLKPYQMPSAYRAISSIRMGRRLPPPP